MADRIRFDRVSFGYDAENAILSNVCLEILKGRSVAFVGPSGCGKSTIVKLLLRLYDPTSGSIYFDGVDLRDARQASLHAQIGVVLQDNFLFNASIRDNLRLAKPDADDRDVYAAAGAAGIHDFIVGLDQSYSTGAGEGGARFSGGQRQRLALARALIRDPSILILDEATSALDPLAEAAVNDTIRALARQRTVIAVTHRLAQVADFDRIFVVANGRISEEGTHEGLLALGGLYRTLWDKQQGFAISENGEVASIEATRLRRIPIFENVEIDILNDIANLFASESIPGAQVVVRQNDRADKFYIIVRGTVEVFESAPDSSQTRVNVLQDGDHFGEIGLLKEIPRTASVKTVTPCLFLTLQRELFRRLIARLPTVRAQLEREVEIRLSRSTEMRSGVALV